jgi:hypothetical protein
MAVCPKPNPRCKAPSRRVRVTQALWRTTATTAAGISEESGARAPLQHLGLAGVGSSSSDNSRMGRIPNDRRVNDE